MKRRLFTSLLAVIVLLAIVTIVWASAGGTFAGFPVAGLVLNGQAFTPSSPPVIINGRTYVPLRFIGEALGARVGWDNDAKTVTIETATAPGGASKSSAVTVIVVDALTRQPVEEATVELKQMIACPQEVGYPCAEGLIIKKKTDKEGRAVFCGNELEKLLEKYTFMIYVSAINYSPSTKELPFNSKDKTIKIELIGGDIAVKTRETAIYFAKKDARVTAWLSKHPHAHPYPAVKFKSPYWIVEYSDKTTCAQYNQEDINCVIIARIDARNGMLSFTA